MVERRGWGKSDGEGYRSAVGNDVGEAPVARLNAEADDVRAALEFAKRIDGVDADRIGVAGWSLGAIVTMLTMNTNGSQAPVWSPDGLRIAYRGTRKGFRNVWVKPVDGTSEEQQLTRGDSVQTPLSWSPDGKHLLYFDATATSSWLSP